MCDRIEYYVSADPSGVYVGIKVYSGDDVGTGLFGLDTPFRYLRQAIDYAANPSAPIITIWDIRGYAMYSVIAERFGQHTRKVLKLALDTVIEITTYSLIETLPAA